ncbi:MAG: hypothetical protein EOP83_10980 [Verrucomicrobiaceae bacterium]|nr:MAG: hypothetical protein EOP83_10980 [Verrucomicrobiaceae bacterium]
MNRCQSLAVAAFALVLSSCVPPPGGYYAPAPPVPGPPRPPGPPYAPGPPVPGGALQAQRDQAYQQGWGFGRKDAMQGRQANYLLYNNYYTSATKKDFANGYMNAYRRFRR